MIAYELLGKPQDAPMLEEADLQNAIADDVAFLAEFRDWLSAWFNRGGSEDRRRAINQGTARARSLVFKTGQAKQLIIRPPPMLGGPIMQIDPFTNLFTDVYGMSVIPDAIDILDVAIGVLQSPEHLANEVRTNSLDGSRLDIQAQALKRVVRICERFHLVARQLQQRHANRAPFPINDEYDAQDLFRAILRLDFDDVRPEEWSPSYAGRASRLDFLLKPERLVIELKRTRKGLKSGHIGEQLIIDIARYQAHPDCDSLVCFVYDPEGRIGNPAELERDLTRRHERIDVRVLVFPSGA